jgi:hypothetical protein
MMEFVDPYSNGCGVKNWVEFEFVQTAVKHAVQRILVFGNTMESNPSGVQAPPLCPRAAKPFPFQSAWVPDSLAESACMHMCLVW